MIAILSAITFSMLILLFRKDRMSPLGEVESLMASFGVRGSISKIKKFDSWKDPGLIWSGMRSSCSGTFENASSLTLGDSFDRDFFLSEIEGAFPEDKIGIDYYLLRGDIQREGMCSSGCALYILQSKVKTRFYGAIYSN